MPANLEEVQKDGPLSLPGDEVCQPNSKNGLAPVLFISQAQLPEFVE